MTGTAPECAALAEGLRAVRSRTGLSLAALAERTPYSKSSWERYLNGKKPPPRQAVEALCTLAGEPPARLLALWELADAEWSGRSREGSGRGRSREGGGRSREGDGRSREGDGRSRTTSKSAEPPLSARALRLRRYLLPVAAALAAVTIAALSVRGSGPERAPVTAPVLDPTPGCQGRACDGREPDVMSCGLPGRVDSLGPQHRTRTGASVEMRYSEVCGAAWGRIWHARVGDSVEISAPGASPRRAVVRNAADTAVYRFTAMIGEPERAGLRVCFTPGDGVGGRECFGP